MGDVPRIETERLVLTWPNEAQIDGYHQAIVGTDLFDTLLWDGPESDRDLHDYWERNRRTELADPFSLAIIERSTDACIGGLALRPVEGDHRILDLGYALAPAWHGRGLGTEAVGALIDHGFAHREAERVFAMIFVGNHASRRLAEKCGMAYEGTLRRTVLKRGRWLDEWMLAVTRPDWERNRT